MPFDRQPHLKGDLLELRPLAPGDFDALYEVASDPLVWEQHPEHDRWQLPVFRAFFDKGLASGGALVATDLADGRVIGSSRYGRLDESTGEVEVGWTYLARRYWGGRHNGEMKRLMFAHAFESARSVVLLIGPSNWRSRRAAEKVGGVFVGMRPNDVGRESAVYRVERPAAG